MSKSRDMILQSAKYLLSYRSLENITVKDICQWAGVAPSTFFIILKTRKRSSAACTRVTTPIIPPICCISFPVRIFWNRPLLPVAYAP